jgi:RNA polymerase subunit RPABC4/transcription elongation factor Spt4
MRFRVHCANPETGEEFDWEVDAGTLQEAEQKAQDAGMLVNRVVPISEPPQPPPKPVAENQAPSRVQQPKPRWKMKVCPSCHKRIRALSAKCPYCHRKQPISPLKWIGTFVLAVIVAGICMGVPLAIKSGDRDYSDISSGGGTSRGSRSSSGSSSTPKKGEAIRMAQKFVTNPLKSPRSAKWPGMFEKYDHVQSLGGGRYRVRSWVDAQNTFGALIRTNYTAVVIDKGGDTWGLESLDIDE